MILSINTNAALDRILFIDRFVPDAHMRTNKEILSVGGKGLDTALVLQALGAPVKVVSFIAGHNGRAIEALLQKEGVSSELIWLHGETRVSTVIVETDVRRHSHITSSGYHITADDCRMFVERVAGLAPQADWAVIAGTLPPGAPPDFYAQLIAMFHQYGVQVLIDAFGAPLCAALAAKPDIVKMNQEEFIQTFATPVDSLAAWPEACQKVMRRLDLKTMVITCGKDGILACTPDGAYLAQGPEQSEVNAAGAGDAVSASLVYRLSLGDDWTQALAWAAATGAAVVLTPGTAECHLDDVHRIHPRICVKKVDQPIITLENTQ